MNARSVIKNFSVAVFAQGIALLMSFLQSLVVPKLLEGDAYGYWQLFIFYSGYVGFFHLGLNDGVYLLEGGHSRNEIDRKAVNSQFVFSLLMETLFAFAIVVLSQVHGFDQYRMKVITATAVYLLIRNAADFIAYVLQAMNETALSSYSVIVERVSFVVLVFALMLVGQTNFMPYIIAYTLASLFRLVYCLFRTRDFWPAGIRPIREAMGLSAESIRVGSKLMIANTASSLIIGIARIGIDATWDISTFGKLALSFSLVTFFLQFIMQASMVLFPALRQSSSQEIQTFIQNARVALAITLPVAYLLYFPMTWLLGLWLPEYAMSFTYFIYLIPICVFDGMMDITCTTYFKVARKEGTLFRINVATALCSALGTVLGTVVLNSLYAVIISIVMCIITRSIVSEVIISRELSIRTDPIVAVLVVLTIGFVVSTANLAPVPACLAYLAAYAAYLFCYRSRIVHLATMARTVFR